MYLVAALIFIASFSCTRGKDGSLTLFFLSFMAIAVIYFKIMANEKRERLKAIRCLRHLLVFQFAGIVGAHADGNLEEMGGSLYVYIPLAITLLTFLPWLSFALRSSDKS